MRKWKVLIGCWLVLFSGFTRAQEQQTNSDRIGFEFGSAVFFGENKVPDRVRAGRSVYDQDDFSWGLPISEQTVELVYGGVKFERFLLKNRLGVSAGLRFSQFSSALEPESKRNFFFGDNYYLWLLKQEELTTDFLKIRDITQKNYYLGIPLEVRFFPQKRIHFCRQYIKLGTVINYHLATHNSIRFLNESMKSYTDAVSDEIEKPHRFNAYVCPTYGFQFGREKLFYINTEIHFPGFFIDSNPHPFIRTDIGFGFQLSVQLPLSLFKNNIK